VHFYTRLPGSGVKTEVARGVHGIGVLLADSAWPLGGVPSKRTHRVRDGGLSAGSVRLCGPGLGGLLGGGRQDGLAEGERDAE
jgi:hypothetical protein